MPFGSVLHHPVRPRPLRHAWPNPGLKCSLLPISPVPCYALGQRKRRTEGGLHDQSHCGGRPNSSGGRGSVGCLDCRHSSGHKPGTESIVRICPSFRRDKETFFDVAGGGSDPSCRAAAPRGVCHVEALARASPTPADACRPACETFEGRRLQRARRNSKVNRRSATTGNGCRDAGYATVMHAAAGRRPVRTREILECGSRRDIRSRTTLKGLSTKCPASDAERAAIA